MRLLLEAEAARRTAESMAVTDALTGAFNRRNFFIAGERRFDHAQRLQEPATVLLLGVDDFKVVNELPFSTDDAGSVRPTVSVGVAMLATGSSTTPATSTAGSPRPTAPCTAPSAAARTGWTPVPGWHTTCTEGSVAFATLSPACSSSKREQTVIEWP